MPKSRERGARVNKQRLDFYSRHTSSRFIFGLAIRRETLDVLSRRKGLIFRPFYLYVLCNDVVEPPTEFCLSLQQQLAISRS